ncbi:hypothetical protein R1sor_009960 [Riccia sorocarpa]|uniref:Uncharacterized protein n=1 Tax=Riccia sorocarpa TaxID=122646 RepID=A0ABD3I2N9_9MARC
MDTRARSLEGAGGEIASPEKNHEWFNPRGAFEPQFDINAGSIPSSQSTVPSEFRKIPNDDYFDVTKLHPAVQTMLERGIQADSSQPRNKRESVLGNYKKCQVYRAIFSQTVPKMSELFLSRFRKNDASKAVMADQEDFSSDDEEQEEEEANEEDEHEYMADEEEENHGVKGENDHQKDEEVEKEAPATRKGGHLRSSWSLPMQV